MFIQVTEIIDEIDVEYKYTINVHNMHLLKNYFQNLVQWISRKW